MALRLSIDKCQHPGMKTEQGASQIEKPRMECLEWREIPNAVAMLKEERRLKEGGSAERSATNADAAGLLPRAHIC